MARRTREEAERTRLAIMDTAMTVFARRGLAGSCLEDVAAELGVTRGAIYGHFRTKRELFEHVIGHSRDMIYDLGRETLEAPGPPLDAIRRFMLGWITLLSDNRRFRDSFEILLNKSELTDELHELYREEKRLSSDTVDALSRAVGRAVDWGQLPERTDRAFAGLLVYTHLMGITQSWLFNPQLFDLPAWSEGLAETMIQTLRTGPAADVHTRHAQTVRYLA